MVRECVLALALASLSGCSLILDFGGEGVTTPDAPFNQAECDYLEPNNTPDSAMVFDPAVDVGPAGICPPEGGGDDLDYYKVTVPANTSVAFKITFVSSPTGDLDLKVTDLLGAQLGSSRGFDNEELITCPGTTPPCNALPAGDYIFEVFPAQPGMVNRYDIAVTVTP